MTDTVCAICNLPCLNPALVNCCENKFCRVCIMMNKVLGAPCPYCQKKSYTWSLTVSCINKDKGCTWQGLDLELIPHLSLASDFTSGTECMFVQKSCLHCFDTYQRKDMEAHIRNCGKCLIPCPNQGEADLEHHDIEQHKNSKCKRRVMSCSNSEAGCKWKGEQKKLDSHLTVCNFNKVVCRFCGEQCKDCDVQNLERILKEEDLHEVLEIAESAATQWYNIGLYLNILPKQLDQIKYHHSGACDCFREMLLTWLRSSMVAADKGVQNTWKGFLKALRSNAVSRNALADDIKSMVICSKRKWRQKANHYINDSEKLIEEAGKLEKRIDEQRKRQAIIIHKLKEKNDEMDVYNKELKKLQEKLVEQQSENDPNESINEEIRLTIHQIDEYKRSIRQLENKIDEWEKELGSITECITMCEIQMGHTLTHLKSLKELLSSHIDLLRHEESLEKNTQLSKWTPMLEDVKSHGAYFVGEYQCPCTRQRRKSQEYKDAVYKCKRMVETLEAKCTSCETYLKELQEMTSKIRMKLCTANHIL